MRKAIYIFVYDYLLKIRRLFWAIFPGRLVGHGDHLQRGCANDVGNKDGPYQAGKTASDTHGRQEKVWPFDDNLYICIY